MPDITIAELVHAAAEGDATAFNALVERFAAMVWAVARSHRLNDADAADVSQTTWLRLAEHLGRLRQPERLGGWLATTARHEAFAVLRRQGRQVPTDLDVDLSEDTEAATLDEGLLRDERSVALWQAFAALPVRCKTLLRMLMADPPPDYQTVSEALDMPIGSIGPTRGRCLAHLRSHPALAGINSGVSGSKGGDRDG